jgi:DNA-directed RNA polymerase subunit beta'
VDYLRGLKENVIMGRLIPAGTGMKYYRNVKVAEDATVNRKEEDEFDEFTDIRGGLDLPAPRDVPGIEADEFDDVEEMDEIGDEETLEIEPEEVFDIDKAMAVENEDDF